MNPQSQVDSSDPTQIISWLTSGGSLNSPSAIGALALLVHLFVIPLIQKIAAYYKYDLNGQNQMFAVYAVSGVLCGIIGYITKTAHNLNETFGYGALVANAAMGIHATRQQLGMAASALTLQRAQQADAAQTKAAMPIPDQK